MLPNRQITYVNDLVAIGRVLNSIDIDLIAISIVTVLELHIWVSAGALVSASSIRMQMLVFG